MKSLWSKVLAFLAKMVGIATLPPVPPEVNGADQSILEWWAIYRSRAPWLNYEYVTADTKKRRRRRFTLNLAKTICAEMAGLVLAENPEVDAGKLVEDLIEREKLWDTLRKTTEFQGALGGQVIKVCLGTDRTGKPEISLDFVKAQNFIPLAWDNTEVYEASFLDRRVIKKTTLVRIETHRRNPEAPGYIITQKVFNEETGIEVPLSQFDESLEEQTTLPGIEKALFAYIRNPEANNIEPESPLGISLFANALDTLQALDLAFDGMKTEILMGRQRVALPGVVMRPYLDPSDGERKLGFDPTDEAYIRLEGDDTDKFKPSDLSGQLRMEQYKLGIQTLLDLLSVQTGFSAGYFSFDGQSVKTATEVVSDNSKTFKTMQAFRENLDSGLKHIFMVVNELGRIYSIVGADTRDPQITWDDSVIEDRNSRTQYWTDLHQNKLVDRVTALQKIHGIDEEAAAEMADKIAKENQSIVMDSIFPKEVMHETA